MEKRIKKIGIITLIIIFAGLVYFDFSFGKSSSSISRTSQQTKAVLSAQNINISYLGETGKDALALLKEHTKVVQDSSGMVSGINGKKVDPKKHEYWAFTVNNKLAPVGPADYQTKNSDKIVWKIETY